LADSFSVEYNCLCYLGPNSAFLQIPTVGSDQWETPTRTLQGTTRIDMADVAQEYLVPDGTSIEDIKALIRTRVRFSEDPMHEVVRRFFDSFDWRRYLARASVEEQLVA